MADEEPKLPPEFVTYRHFKIKLEFSTFKVFSQSLLCS